MFSVGEARKRLPEDFVKNLYQMFSPGIADQILAGMLNERATTLRANTLKNDIQALMNRLKKANIKFDRVLWYKDALILKNAREKEIESLQEYQEGRLYLQSLSSMLPPLVLAPQEGESVLDLTAAPGGKTTQIAAMMNNKGRIAANEMDKIRYEKLVFNLNRQGASIVESLLGKGEKLGERMPEAFDRVLLDAPCSGEGLFLMPHPMTFRPWSKHLVEKLSSMQKKLLTSAVKALKKNGILVYSTCTLNFEENENNVEWAIENLGVKPIEIPLKIFNSLKAVPKKYKETAHALRIIPSKTLEGFFVACLKKNH